MSHSAGPQLSRRDCLKAMGAGVATVTTSRYLPGEVRPALAGVPTPPHSWGMLVDMTGCNSGTLACRVTEGEQPQ